MLSVALLGYGHIGKRHAAVIRSIAGASLVAICDEDASVKPAEEDTDIPWFTSIEALLQSGIEFELVSIATPNGLHEAHALQLLQAGKHVLIEKPMALNSAGCNRIIQAAAHFNKQVFCVMQNRYAPAAQWLKGIMEQKLLGSIYLVQINCFWNRDARYYTGKGWHGNKELDGGTLFTQFSHFVDSLYWLFGDIENIQSTFGNFSHRRLIEFEDTGLIQFDLKSGGKGSFQYTTSVYDRNLESSMTIIAENGTVKIAGQYMDEVTVCHIRDYQLPELEPSVVSHHTQVYENLINTLNGKQASVTNAADGMKVVEMVERMYEGSV